MTRTFVKYVCAAALMLAVVELTSSAPAPRAGAAGRVTGRIGMSIAAHSGPDGDRNIGRNWRTYLKHQQLDAARASRDPFQDWLDKFFPRDRKPQPETQSSHLDWNLQTGGIGSVVGYPAEVQLRRRDEQLQRRDLLHGRSGGHREHRQRHRDHQPLRGLHWQLDRRDADGQVRHPTGHRYGDVPGTRASTARSSTCSSRRQRH